ncbi:MAG TPA: lipoyl synthase [Kiritimatiellia bacterium]|nr:lipoyl synthase [Kiritimatiellia bacterium]HMO99255.1 lipoyl synthase [Kiritimatiellia bacterium]HMP96953.1 lipoyl synthase [Kiritimatiellia bacterium]
MPRIPEWIRLKWKVDSDFAKVHNLVGGLGLHTVCQSAKCPNIHECWGAGTATIMLLGNLCTRNCKFCSVPHGRPLAVDTGEPRRVADAARGMKLNHIVLTSVNRDDLPDGGAAIFAETIVRLREAIPGLKVEVLTPDFEGNESAMRTVFEAWPDVFSHNIETVERLQAVIRPQASYGRSLSVLRAASEWRPKMAIKSGIMLGMGETSDEVEQAMRDLFEAGCRILTLGQYLQPTRHNRPVDRYVMPREFDAYAATARQIGFAGVASGPMVRSSYKAEELLQSALEQDPELYAARSSAVA